MKKSFKLFLSVSALILTTNTNYAQSNHLTISTGYGHNTSSSNLYYLDFYNSTSGETPTPKNK